MERIHTAIRAPEDWLEEVGATAVRYGVSRNNMIVLCTRLGVRILNDVKLSPEQLDVLLRKEACATVSGRERQAGPPPTTGAGKIARKTRSK